MITIKSGRHPLAVTFLAFCGMSGAVNLFAYARSATNAIRALPSPLGQVFYAALTAGSAIALAGIFMRGVIGPIVERAGLTMLTGLLGGYAVLVFSVAGARALFIASLLLGISAGCAWRAFQIRRELRVVRAAAVKFGAVDQLGGLNERWRRHGAGGRSGKHDRWVGDAADGQGAAGEADGGGRKDQG